MDYKVKDIDLAAGQRKKLWMGV